MTTVNRNISYCTRLSPDYFVRISAPVQCVLLCVSQPTRQLYHIEVLSRGGSSLSFRRTEENNWRNATGTRWKAQEMWKKWAKQIKKRVRQCLVFGSYRVDGIRNHYQTVLSCYHRYHTKDTFFDANSTIHILGTMRTHDIVRAFRHYRLITTSSVRVDVCVLDTRVTVIVHGFRSVLFDVFKLCARRLNPCTFDRTANRYDPREKSDGARFFVAVYYYLFFVARGWLGKHPGKTIMITHYLCNNTTRVVE